MINISPDVVTLIVCSVIIAFSISADKENAHNSPIVAIAGIVWVYVIIKIIYKFLYYGSLTIY